MARKNSLLTRAFGAAFLTILLATSSQAFAFAATQAGASDAAAAQPNFIQAKQFHLVNARLPGRLSAHQNVTAWQVAAGSWAGEKLDGLSLVFVQSISEGNPANNARQVNCYVSSQATLAQRQALLTAFIATQPETVSQRDISALRLEPAVITLEINGESVVLHLGLIA